jgi:hypothetical protein
MMKIGFVAATAVVTACFPLAGDANAACRTVTKQVPLRDGWVAEKRMRVCEPECRIRTVTIERDNGVVLRRKERICRS